MRTAEFDREEVLRKAMCLFRSNGYAATSMQDLVNATGLHPGSLYAAFKNKRGLLLAVVEFYIAIEGQRLEQCFDTPSALEGIHNFLQQIAEQCAACDGNTACLVSKSLQEFFYSDPEIAELLSENLLQLERRFAEVLKSAQANGELVAAADPQRLARMLIVGIHGMRTYAHTHPGRDVLMDLVAQLMEGLPRTGASTQPTTALVS